jgi:DNA-binding NarL/FixJ family response regulator
MPSSPFSAACHAVMPWGWVSGRVSRTAAPPAHPARPGFGRTPLGPAAQSERISTILRSHRPRVLILDVAQLRNLGQVRELTVEFALTCLVLLSTGQLGAESSQLLAFGASACLRKDAQGRDLLNAIHLASRGLQLMPLGAPDLHGTQVRDSLLTAREGDVLLLLRQGRSNA